MNLQERVQQLTSNGYEFKFCEYFSKGWDLFGKKVGHYIGFFVLMMLMLMVSAFIPVIGGIASQLLGAVFLVGFFVFTRNIKYNQNPNFDDFFKGFSSFGRIAVVQLILLAFILVVMIPLIIFGFSIFFKGIIGAASNPYYEPRNPAELFELFDLQALIPLMIITYIFLFFIQTIYMFSTAITHFYQSSPWQSMEASRKVIQKKFFHFFGLLIVIALINILGVICLFVGLLVTVPLTYTIIYAAFDDIFQPESAIGLEAPDESFENREN